MIKKVIKFLDRHRLILIICILLVLVCLFLTIKSYIFLNYDFKPLSCTKNNDDETCYHDGILIYKNPEEIKKEKLDKYKEEIDYLIDTYSLPKLDMYYFYFYQIVVNLEYAGINDGEELLEFFKIYSATYNLEEFYIKNSFYYSIFKNYKLPININ